ncbi:hypothetical protein [Novosphingobium sp. BL-52-GroH]|uniref:hypothetical protein n=1 Tax=Novosphingobium sp. BL-52-GroH TaxID=3349877 RepID=UPI00384CE9C2
MMMLLHARHRGARDESYAADPLGRYAVEIRDEQTSNRIVFAYDRFDYSRPGAKTGVKDASQHHAPGRVHSDFSTRMPFSSSGEITGIRGMALLLRREEMRALVACRSVAR